MNKKTFRARVQHKHKTEAQWILDVYTDATKTTLREDPFIPLGGELIVFDKDDTYDYDRIKFGDGINNVIALPFASASYTLEKDGNNIVLKKNGIVISEVVYADVEANGNSGLMTGIDKAKLDSIENEANKTIVDEVLNKDSSNPVQNKVIKTALDNKLETSLKGTSNGLAELDANGKVPSAQLPSYVDDVLEYAKKSSFPSQGESGKIYVDLDKNLTYRWSGSTYVEISPSLALGETESTAYRGDRGKIAYEHSQSQHAPVDAEKNVQSDWAETNPASDAYIKNKPTIPSGFSQGEAENSMVFGINAQAISQGSTAMGVDIVAGSKAFYISAIDSNEKKIYLKTNDIPNTESERDNILTPDFPYIAPSEEWVVKVGGDSGAVLMEDGRILPSLGGYVRVYTIPKTFDFPTLSIFEAFGYDSYDLYMVMDGTDEHVYVDTIKKVKNNPLAGYEIGDEFSIIRDKHYAFCGTITNIETNVITYDNYVMTGVWQNNKPKDKTITANTFATKASTNGKELWEDCIFWVPKKPHVGFRIWNHDESNPQEVFQGVNVFGTSNFGSSDKAFVAGEDNAAGGNGATILGTRNRGAYGNIIGGGDNFSNGLHSMIFGRYNANLADYNVLVNMNNTVEAGSANNNNFLSGQYNKVTKGSCNFIGGYNNLLTNGSGDILGGRDNTIANSTYSVIGGNAHKNVDGDQCIIAGNNHTISGRSHYNAIFGQSNTVASSSKWNEVSGSTNSLTYSVYNTVSGFTNTLTYAENNIVGGTENKLTGTPSAKLINNLICGAKIKVTAGSGNILGGQENEIKSGNGNAIGGYNNTLTGTYVGVFGNKHLVYGDQNFAVGTENSIGYDANKIASKKSSYNVVGGRGNKIGQTRQVWDSAVFGQNNVINHTGVLAVGANHTSSRDYQILLGNGAKEDSSSALILANSGTNVLTFGTTGTRASVGTDIVTVDYLKNNSGASTWQALHGEEGQDLHVPANYLSDGTYCAYLSADHGVGDNRPISFMFAFEVIDGCMTCGIRGGGVGIKTTDGDYRWYVYDQWESGCYITFYYNESPSDIHTTSLFYKKI